MKVSIVNENRKDIKYVITDTTPELNLPVIPSRESINY